MWSTRHPDEPEAMRLSYFPATLEKEDQPTVLYNPIPVLLVDDEPMALELCTKLLNRLGFIDVDPAEDGVAALRKLMDRKYSIVISDWNMPVMNGLELLRTMRIDDQLRRTPFIMTSVDGGFKRARLARQAGVSAFLIKPFDAVMLRAKIQEVMRSVPAHQAA
jgi:two-component system chemotaxis response regulator CheY